jgi:hypothetical protein
MTTYPSPLSTTPALTDEATLEAKYRTKVVKPAGTGVDAAQYSIAPSADSQTHTERYSWLSSHAF